MRVFKPSPLCDLTCEGDLPKPEREAYALCDIHNQWWEAQLSIGGMLLSPPKASFVWVKIPSMHVPLEILKQSQEKYE